MIPCEETQQFSLEQRDSPSLMQPAEVSGVLG